MVTRGSASWVVEGKIIEIQTRASAERIRTLRADEGIANFNPPEEEKEILAGISTGLNGNVTVAIQDGALVGYVVVEKPDPRTRWGEAKLEALHELEVVEVSRNHRKQGLARKMLELIFSDSSMERLIVLATEYLWHWDLAGSGLGKAAYRQMMRSLSPPSVSRKRRPTSEHLCRAREPVDGAPGEPCLQRGMAGFRADSRNVR